jgi:NAD(P)H dehydrogenase (quinone)
MCFHQWSPHARNTGSVDFLAGSDVFGMVIVGLDYGHAGQMTLDEITGGSPYGATTITGGDGSRLPTANELQGARYQGRKIAETANKLHG